MNLEQLAREGLTVLGRWGARAIATGLDSALADAKRGLGQAAREVDRRIAHARARLENIVEMPHDVPECDLCGWRHTGQCWVNPCGQCGNIHTGDVQCSPKVRRRR
jgi:hypothetical protein